MDSLGTTSIVTDYSTGAVVQDELHYPWGQQWAMLGTMQEERFARLHHRDTETSLDPTLHRMFSSNEGRWMTPDPAGAQSVNFAIPQSLDRYAYALNNPTTLIDPLGLDSIPFHAPSCGGMVCADNPATYGGLPYPGYQNIGSQDPFDFQLYTVCSGGECGTGFDFNGATVANGLSTSQPPQPGNTPPSSPPQPPPNPSAQATIHGQYLQWRACFLDELRTELAAGIAQDGINGENPNLPLVTFEATLKAGASCLSEFPLAALDPAYNGPPPGDVFEPPPFPFRLFGPY